MIDDARSVWELIERRARPTPDRVMLYDGDRTHHVRGVPRAVRARRGRAVLRLGCRTRGRTSRGSCRRGRNRRCSSARLCRLGAVQNPMLPIYRVPRGVVHRQADELQAARSRRRRGTSSTTQALAEQVAGENDDMHTLVADHHNPEGDPATLPRRPRSTPTRPQIRCAGSSTRRARPPTRRARNTPTARCWPARSATRRRRTSSPTTSRSSRSRSRTSAASSSACTRRCSPARPRC